MGKGDKKTRRGKLFNNSYGRTRPRKKTTGIAYVKPAPKQDTKKAEEAEKIAAEEKVSTKEAPVEKKAAKPKAKETKATAPKKEAEAKKAPKSESKETKEKAAEDDK